MVRVRITFVVYAKSHSSRNKGMMIFSQEPYQDFSFSLLRHMKIEHQSSSKALKCSFPDCSYQTNRKDNLSRHYVSVHCDPVTEKTIVCEICGTKFSSNSAFKLHRKSHFQTFKCRFCSEKFNFPQTRASHEVKFHSKSSRSRQCIYCSRQFVNIDAGYVIVIPMGTHIFIQT